MLSHWLNTIKISRAVGRCIGCGKGLARIEVPYIVPPVLHFTIDNPCIKFDLILNISVGGMAVRYALRSVMYIGNNHFTTRIIKENGDIWYHDSIKTGTNSISDGNMHSTEPGFLNTCDRDGIKQQACGVIYAVVDL
jgi:hypothetical protein